MSPKSDQSNVAGFELSEIDFTDTKSSHPPPVPAKDVEESSTMSTADLLIAKAEAYQSASWLQSDRELAQRLQNCTEGMRSLISDPSNPSWRAFQELISEVEAKR